MNGVLKIVLSVIALLVMFFCFIGVDYVGPGNVGIVVKLSGTDRGVDDVTVKTGYVFYSRWTQQVYEYPTSLIRTSFTQDETEESPTNEEITFNAKGGVSVSADIALHFQIPADSAPHVFVLLRNDVTAVRQYLKSKTREVVGNIASTMTINDVYNNKSELMAQAKKQLQENIGTDIHIETLTFISALRIDPKIQEGINATIAAEQQAIAAQNKVAQSKAEADQKIEDARGRGESVLLEAQKQAEANKVLTASLTPELIQWQAVTKWSGILPNVTGGAVPFIQLPGVK